MISTNVLWLCSVSLAVVSLAVRAWWPTAKRVRNRCPCSFREDWWFWITRCILRPLMSERFGSNDCVVLLVVDVVKDRAVGVAEMSTSLSLAPSLALASGGVVVVGVVGDVVGSSNVAARAPTTRKRANRSSRFEFPNYEILARSLRNLPLLLLLLLLLLLSSAVPIHHPGLSY